MAHDTKTLLRDGSGITPVPQFFNPTADDFRPLTGVDLGNGRYGADGLIWGKTSGGVYVPVKCNADGAVVTELSGSIPAGTNNIGDVDLASAIPAGSAIIGKVGIDQTTPGTTNKVVAELSGSNTRVTASDTILMGGAGVGAHTALDVVSTEAGEILEFSTGLSAGSSGIILSSLVTLNQNAVFSGGAGYTLHLYNAAPTAIADNAAYTLAAADLAKYIGNIAITPLVDFGDSCAAHDIGHNVDFKLAVADTKLYGILVCDGGETTIDAKTLTINLGIAAL